LEVLLYLSTEDKPDPFPILLLHPYSLLASYLRSAIIYVKLVKIKQKKKRRRRRRRILKEHTSYCLVH
jgi:hypothetical protein